MGHHPAPAVDQGALVPLQGELGELLLQQEGGGAGLLLPREPGRVAGVKHVHRPVTRQQKISTYTLIKLRKHISSNLVSLDQYTHKSLSNQIRMRSYVKL